MKSLILILVAMSGCGSQPTTLTYTPPPVTVDPEFRELVTKFVHEAALRHVPLNLTRLTVTGLEDLSEADKYPQAAGICYPTEVRVEVKMPYWRTLNDIVRERLIFHELGHCLLGRIHREIQVMTPDGPYYGSLMEPRLFTEHSELRAYYLDELFGKI